MVAFAKSYRSQTGLYSQREALLPKIKVASEKAIVLKSDYEVESLTERVVLSPGQSLKMRMKDSTRTITSGQINWKCVEKHRCIEQLKTERPTDTI